MKPKELSLEQLNHLVHSVQYFWVADWLNNYIVKKHPESEKMREEWMQSDHPMAQRAGWNLTSVLAAKKSEVLDYEKLLSQLEEEMLTANKQAQWTMNFTLVEIGINYPEHRERALAIGEKLGIYSDYKAAKGCTSPYAPIWIEEMVKRQKTK
jgi:3-methyladenine DNA glycosylase AlkD